MTGRKTKEIFSAEVNQGKITVAVFVSANNFSSDKQAKPKNQIIAERLIEQFLKLYLTLISKTIDMLLVGVGLDDEMIDQLMELNNDFDQKLNRIFYAFKNRMEEKLNKIKKTTIH